MCHIFGFDGFEIIRKSPGISSQSDKCENFFLLLSFYVSLFLFDFDTFCFLSCSLPILNSPHSNLFGLGCIEIFAQFHLSRFTLARFYFYDHVIVLPLCRCFVQYVFESHRIIQNSLFERTQRGRGPF